MQNTVFLYGNRIQAIVDKTMRDYPLENMCGVGSYEYSDKIPTQRMLDDVAGMKEVFSDCVNNTEYSFDDRAAVFAMLCTCCTKYNLDYTLSDQFDVDSFLTGITDEKEHKFLSLLGTAICGMMYPHEDTSTSCFREAYKLFPDNEIINLYRFIRFVQLLYTKERFDVAIIFASDYSDYADTSDWQEVVRRDMIGAYSKLSLTLQEYAIVGKNESNARDDNLPYVEYTSFLEKCMDACLSDFQGIVKGVHLDIKENETQWLLKMIDTILRELREKNSVGTQFESSPIYWNLISLFRRLNALQEPRDKDNNSAEDVVVGGNNENRQDEASTEYDRNKLSLLSRKHLLAIPCLIEPSASNFHNVFKETLRAEIRTVERDCAIDDKATVIRDFAHTYGNMKATGLYAIAQALLKNEDIESKRLGRQVLLEYGIKQDLTKAVYMMRLRFEENTKKLRELLRDSVAEGSETDTEGIDDIMSSALQLSLLRVFYDSSDSKAKLARNQLKKAVEKLNPLRDSFEHEVIFSGTDAIRWMSKCVTPLDISVSDGWKQLAFRKESYATVFLRDIFAECFFNTLKYADLMQPISFNLSESGNEFRIELVNTVAQMDMVYSGVGLSSKSAMLDIVNGRKANAGIESSMTGCVCDGNFYTHISLAKSILEGE